MKVILKPGALVLVPETDAESEALADWKAEQAGHVFLARQTSGTGQAFVTLGPREEACREPINITSMSKDPAVKLISNFAPTPFTLDGREYASVEGFWQGLKFPRESDRRRLAALSGGQARKAGEEQPYETTLEYGGETVVVGT